MRFESFAEFISMDGQGLYIWMAYIITLVVVLVNLWWPGRVRDNFIRAEKRREERRIEQQQTQQRNTT